MVTAANTAHHAIGSRRTNSCRVRLSEVASIFIQPLSFVQQQSDWPLVRISTLLNTDVVLNGVGRVIVEKPKLCNGDFSCQATLLCCLATEQAAVACIFEDTAKQNFGPISQKC